MTTATPTPPQTATEIATGIATDASDYPPDQHTLGRSILLHLLPAALILVARHSGQVHGEQRAWLR